MGGEALAERALVVANARAGGVAGDWLAEFAEPLREVAPQVETMWTESQAEAADRVAEAVGAGETDLVIACGGDGTVRGVAEGLARGLGHWPLAGGEPEPPSAGSEEPALLVVPAGTGNSVYRALWGDLPFAEVLATLRRPDSFRRRRLDLGVVRETDTLFLLGATAGLVAQVVEVAMGLQAVSGRDRYAEAALSALAQPALFDGAVWLDGELLAEGTLTLVAVGGARHRGGSFQLLPRSVLDDGLLDVCVAADRGPARLGELAMMVLSGAHVGEPEVSYGSGTEVVLERRDGSPLKFEIDGDLSTGREERLTMAVVPGAVPAICPVEPVAG